LFIGSLGSNAPAAWVVCLYAALFVAARYEGLLLVLAASAILIYRKQTAPALKLTLAGFLPILLFGLLSLSKGGRFIPPALLQPLGTRIYTAAIMGCILVIIILKAKLIIRQKKKRLAASLLGAAAVIRSFTLFG